MREHRHHRPRDEDAEDGNAGYDYRNAGTALGGDIEVGSGFTLELPSKTDLIVPFFKTVSYPLGIFGFMVLSYLVIVGSSNAVNLTDGLDGLAIMPTVLVGAALGISYTADITKRTAFAALIAGVACGALGPELIAWAFNWKLPIIINNIFALICGIGGMYVVPGLLTVWRGFASDPWAFLDRLRGISKKGDGQ